MELSALGDLVAVVRAGSFAGAARATGTPKSTLSKHVRDLEASLGQRLLERSTRKLRLTAEGALLVERGERLLLEFRELEHLVRDRDVTPRGRLRVAVPVLFGQSFMGEITAAYVGRWPDTRIDVTLTDRRVDLIEEDYDCAIRVGELEDSTWVTRTFAYSERRVVAAPALVRRFGTPRTPKDLERWPTIGFVAGHAPVPWSLQRGASRVTLVPSSAIALNNLPAVRAAALSGGGAAMLPELLVAHDVGCGALVPLLEAWRSPADPLRLIFPERRHLSARLRAFIDVVTERFPDKALGAPRK